MKRMIKGEIANLIDEKIHIYPDFGPVVEGNLGIDGDFIATQGVRAKTLEQTEPNLTITATPTIPTGLEVPSDTEPFIAIKLVNGVLWFIAVIELHNPTESAITGALTLFPTVAIPEDLAKKIYRLDGTSVDQAYTARSTICDMAVMQGTQVKRAVLSSYSAKTLNIYVDSASISAGGSAVYSMRFPILVV